jgi:diguanylate cyclase (GGDEF)-like protein
VWESRHGDQHRTLRSGKIIFNNQQSVFNCLIRNLSPIGACLQVNDSAGIPESFELLIDGSTAPRPCQLIWLTETRAGIEFKPADVATASQQQPRSLERLNGNDLTRNELLTLRAALDLVPVGIVLLDATTRAQFINLTFRRMWRLPNDKAERKPPFVALMYHGCDTKAYAVSSSDLDRYVAERVAHVKSGDPKPLDLRLTNGEVVRLQCAVLPSGGRMLCYTYVTDIVRPADELGMLRSALDEMQPGIILLDAFLNAQFMNRAVRELWGVPDAQADRKPAYSELVNDARRTGTYGVSAEELDEYIEGRIAIVRAGDPSPMDLRHGDGRIIRSQCAVLPGGGRMLTYSDVTDLVARAKQFEELATTDGMTGLYNRRHFEALAEAEWRRFQRYNRTLSMLLIDIDEFKRINDRFGHEAGDEALKAVAKACMEDKRSTDIVARVGGDELAMLLPETNLPQARIVAQRVQEAIHKAIPKRELCVTLSVGVAEASLSMSGFQALLRLADEALYVAKSEGRNCIRDSQNSHAGENRAAAE